MINVHKILLNTVLYPTEKEKRNLLPNLFSLFLPHYQYDHIISIIIISHYLLLWLLIYIFFMYAMLWTTVFFSGKHKVKLKLFLELSTLMAWFCRKWNLIYQVNSTGCKPLSQAGPGCQVMIGISWDQRKEKCEGKKLKKTGVDSFSTTIKRVTKNEWHSPFWEHADDNTLS